MEKLVGYTLQFTLESVPFFISVMHNIHTFRYGIRCIGFARAKMYVYDVCYMYDKCVTEMRNGLADWKLLKYW